MCLMWRYAMLLCLGLSLLLIYYYHCTPALRLTPLSKESPSLGLQQILVSGPTPHTLQELSAEGLMQMWTDMRTEFVSTIRKLLSNGTDESDKRLIRLIQRHMFPPSKKNYKMSFNYGPPPQTQVATDYFKSKEQSGGFFVECGGLDGERSSNTYHLEKDGWQGLLIEADPDYFLQSLGKNRRSWKLNAALCPSAEPGIVSFKDSPNKGHGKLLPGGNHEVPCIPLALVMKALNRTRIDFFSLDVEGLEVKILRSLPYKELDIRAITMEYNHDKETPAEINTFMQSVGYKLHKRIDKHDHNQRLYTNDLFYIKKET